MRTKLVSSFLFTFLFFYHFTLAQTGWYDSDWTYRRSIAVANTGGTTLNDFQVLINLDSSFDFTKSKSDGSDIRFTTNDGVTLIPYWIESWNPSTTSANVWIKVPSISTTGTNVFMYYGNPAADFPQPDPPQVTDLPPTGPWTNVAGLTIAGSPGSLLAENMVEDGGIYWQLFANRSICNAQLGFAYNNTGNPGNPTGWTWWGNVTIDFSVRSTHPRFSGDSRLNTTPGNLLNPYLDCPHVEKGDDGNWYLFYHWITGGDPHGSCGCNGSWSWTPDAYAPIGVAVASSITGPYVEIDPLVLESSELEGDGDAWDWTRVSEPYVFKRDDGKWIMLFMGDKGNYDDPGNSSLYYIEQCSYAIADNITGPYTKWQDGVDPFIAFGSPGSLDAGTIADTHPVKIDNTYYIFYAASPTTWGWKTTYLTTDDWETVNKSSSYVYTNDGNSPFRGAISKFNDIYYFSYLGSSASSPGPFMICTQPAVGTIPGSSSIYGADVVFDFYDGFDSAPLNTTKWNNIDPGYSGTATVSGGDLVICNSGGFITEMTAKQSFGVGYTLEIKAKHSLSGFAGELGWGRQEPTSSWGGPPFNFVNQRVMDLRVLNSSYFMIDADNADHSESPGDYIVTSAPLDFTNYLTHKISRVDNNSVAFQIDSYPISTIDNSLRPTRITTNPLSPWFFVLGGSCLNVDWVKIRKYANPDPLASIGSEETSLAIVSDDFYPETSAQSFWHFYDPVGDCSLTLNGTNAHIDVGAGVSHDLWSSGIKAPRLLQATPNSDFGIEVKFESAPSARYQMQGIIVQEDDDTILRFEVYHDGASPIMFAAFVDAGTGSTTLYHNSPPAPTVVPSYLRVERSGNTWTFKYSFDGSSWTTATTFSRTFTVTEVGFYGANHTPNTAFTANADYFMSLADPITDTDSEIPSVPVLISPEDLATEVSIEPIFSWNAAEGATSYTLQVAADAAFTNLVFNNSSLTSTSHQITGLLNNTIYYWRVSAENSSGSSGFSDSRSFTTVARNVPILSWPIGGTIVYLSSQWMYWYPSIPNPELKYDLLYSTNPSMISPTIIGDIISPYNLSGLEGSTVYYWQVRSKTAEGAISAYSSISSFQTIAFYTSPPVPFLSWPIGGAIVYTNSPTLYWYPGTWGVGLTYDVEYSTGALSGTPSISDIDAMNVILIGLASGTTYNWHVRSYDGITYSDWSSPQSFQTIAAPTPLVPVPSWPIGGAAVYTSSPTLYWYLNGPSTGLTYDVEYSTGTLTGVPTYTGVTSMFQSLSGLTSGTIYNWQVRSSNGTSTSSWSSQESFTIAGGITGPIVPTLSWPIGGTTVYTTSPILYWYISLYRPDLTYDIEYSTGALTGTPTITDITSLNYVLSGLTSGATYNWQVRSFDGSTYSEWSVQESFSTIAGSGGPGVPTPSWPIGGTTVYNNSPVLYWFVSTGSSGLTYDLEYSVNADMSVATTITGIAQLYAALSGLTSGTPYYWRVRSFDGISYSAFSITESFITNAGSASVVPVAASPADGVTLETSSPTLSWFLPTTSVPLTYELQYSTDPDMNNSATINNLQKTFESVSGLDEGVKYYWRIRSMTSDGKESAFSNIESFILKNSITGAESDPTVPKDYELKQNYPNPFNPITLIEFSITNTGHYSLIVYNIIGQKIASLMDEDLNPGTYNITFDASELVSGMYFYRLTGNDISLTRKMLLIK